MVNHILQAFFPLQSTDEVPPHPHSEMRWIFHHLDDLLCYRILSGFRLLVCSGMASVQLRNCCKIIGGTLSEIA